jgi:hypothetical protein
MALAAGVGSGLCRGGGVALTEIGARRERRAGELRRSRLLPWRAAWSTRPGSITGARVIDVSARLREREVGVLITQRLATRRPLGTQLHSTDQPQWPPGDLLPVPERQPVTPLSRAAQNPRERVLTARVDELKSGEIDHDRRRTGRSRIELAVENRSGYPVKRATQPDDQRPSSSPPGNHDIVSRDRVASVANRRLEAPRTLTVGCRRASPSGTRVEARFPIAVPPPYGIAACAAIRLYTPVREVHAAPAAGPVSETVTEGRGDSEQPRHRGFG